MTSYERTITDIGCILATAYEAQTPLPENTLYLALECDLERLNRVRLVLTDQRAITIQNRHWTLTPIGEKLGAKCAKTLAH